MKTKAFGECSMDEHYSQGECESFCRDLNAVSKCVVRVYLEGRMPVGSQVLESRFSGEIDISAMKKKKGFPCDGRFTCERQNSSTCVLFIRYTEGPLDRQWMENLDTIYLSGVLKQGESVLRQKERGVWYLWKSEGATSDIGEWWVKKLAECRSTGKDIAKILEQAEKDEKQNGDRIAQTPNQAKPPELTAKQVAAATKPMPASPQPARLPLQAATTASTPPPSTSTSPAVHTTLTQSQLDLQVKADEYYAKAKMANLAGKHEEAGQNFYLAKDTYKKLTAQGVDCEARLKKIKQSMDEVQTQLRSSASAGSQRSSSNSTGSHGSNSSGGETAPQAKSPVVPAVAAAATAAVSPQREDSHGVIDQAKLAQSLDIKYEELTKEKELGSGGFGVVYKGSWQMTEVAIKELHIKTMTAEALQEFAREAQFMAGLRYPQIVQLFGICQEPGHYCMVMEYMVKGSLYGVLHSNQEVPWQVRWNIALDVGVGVNFLHNKDIIHRDLKSLNVLLDENMRAKLSDFGLAAVRTESSKTVKLPDNASGKRNPGTVPWMAPELFKRGGKTTKESDVYAYGMVLWEMASRKDPFGDAESQEQITGWIVAGEKEAIPADCPPKLATLISKCWQERTQRPKVEEVIAEIKAAQKTVQTGGAAAVAATAATTKDTIIPAATKHLPPARPLPTLLQSGPNYQVNVQAQARVLPTPQETAGASASNTKGQLQSGPQYHR